jgi:GTP-binding protein
MVIVANKIDKVKKSQVEPNINVIRDTLQLHDDTQVITFSAEKGTNRSVLLAEIDTAIGNW